MKELIGKLNYGNRGPAGPAGPQGPQGPAGEYIAGEGISIVDNVISATGSAVDIDNQTIIKNADDQLTTAVGGYTSHEDNIGNGVPYIVYFPTNKEFRILTDDTYYGTQPYVANNRTYYKPQDDFCDAFVDFILQWYDEPSQTLDANIDMQFNSEPNYEDPDYNYDLEVTSAKLHFTTISRDMHDEIVSIGEGDQALELTVFDNSTQTETIYSYRAFCRNTKATWRSFYIKPSNSLDIDNPEWQFLIHQFTKFWFYIDPDVYQNAPEINNWYDVEVHQIDSKFIPEDTSKLDATLCTYQTTEPTEDISDGGVHIVYLQSEPVNKYEGYIYLIAEV